VVDRVHDPELPKQTYRHFDAEKRMPPPVQLACRRSNGKGATHAKT
jgi:hypothetical protein